MMFTLTWASRYRGLARPVVAAFYGVVEQAEHAVAVVLVVLGCVDSALGGDAVRSPWGVVVSEDLHLVAELAQRRSRRGASETVPIMMI